MLSTSAQELHEEIEAAMEWMRRHLFQFEEMVRKYHGMHYMEGAEDWGGERTIENHYHDWMSYIRPFLCATMPKFRLGTARGQSVRMDVMALQAAINQLMRDTHRDAFLRRGPLTDMQFNFGITITSREPIKGMRPIESPHMVDEHGSPIRLRPHRPMKYRCPQDWYYEDPRAMSRDDIRFQGHMEPHDLEDLEDEAEDSPKGGWNLAALRRADAGSDTPPGSRQNPRGPWRREIETERGEVWIYRTWVPEVEEGRTKDGREHPGPEEGYHGTIFTHLVSEPGVYLKGPEPYYGPPTGPYQMYGAGTVPNDGVPLAPLVVVEEQIRELNRQAVALSKSAEDFKRLIFVNKKSPNIVRAVKSAKHHYVVPIKGFVQTDIAQVDLGGPHELQIVATALAKSRLDRNASFHETQRGVASEQATATAINEAGQSSDVRMGGIDISFREGVVGDAEKDLWFLFHDNETFFPVSQELLEEAGMELVPVQDPNTGGMLLGDDDQPIMVKPTDVQFYGGAGDSDLQFAELELILEPESMKHVDRGMKQAMRLEALDRAINYAELIPVLGKGVRWKRVYEFLAATYNDPSLGDLVDVDKMLRQPASFATNPRLASPGQGADRLQAFHPARGASPIQTQGGKAPPLDRGGRGGRTGNFSGNKTGAKLGSMAGAG